MLTRNELNKKIASAKQDFEKKKEIFVAAKKRLNALEEMLHLVDQGELQLDDPGK